ncbi:hypothetical protein JW859_11875 [bacterium]|nr:hypothetical protein [bacterium]
MSVRARLTLWHAAVLLVLLMLFAGGVYLAVRASLLTALDRELDSGYDAVASVMRISGGDIYDIYHFGREPAFILFNHGQPVYLTQGWCDAGLPVQAADLESGYTTLATGDGHWRVRFGAVDESGYALAYAVDARLYDEALQRLGFVLVLGAAVAALLALAGGFLLAGRALAPISTIDRRLRDVTARSLADRLPVANPADELGRLVTTINATLARLEGAFEELRRFTADASHELRTPLAAIRSVGEVALQDGADDGDRRQALTSILEEAARLSQLLETLLALARFDAGTARPAPQEVDLAALAGEVVDELAVLAEERRQALVLAAAAPVTARVDPQLLRQALVNIVHNAIRYTPEGGRITVAVSRHGGRAVLDVTDTGPGIPPDERELVFARFYRCEGSRSREGGGAGLGLAIARWAVAAQGGTIAFLNADQGAHCRIELASDG